MKRLFISLYILILVGLLTIGWGGEWLWRTIAPPPENTELKKIAQISILGVTNLEQAQTRVEQLQAELGWPVTLMPSRDYAAMQASSESLNKPLVLYNQNSQPMVLMALPKLDLLLKIGPLTTPNESQEFARIKSGLRLFSYLLLAIFVALWTWPLWRDLKLLSRATQSFAAGRLETTAKLSSTSAIKELGDNFNHMARQIERLIEEQKLMLNAVSHDLRTPLAKLKFELLSVTDQKTQQAMQADIQALERLVDELLQYARFEQNSQHLQIQAVPVVKIVNLQQQQVSCPVSFVCQLEPSFEWPCDGFLFERLVQNLLSNAEKYASENICIGLSVVHKNNQAYLQLSVEDDGPGIAEEEQRAVFQPFYRAGKTTHKSGFGLGLAIVQRICDWHHGDAQVVRSDLGGARFIIHLSQHPC